VELFRVEADAKNRCQHASGATGQCLYAVIEGKKYCQAHISFYGNDPQYNKQAHLRRYKISSYYARTGELFKDEEFKSLREEITIMKFHLEELCNLIRTPWDLQVYGMRVELLIERIGKLQVMNHKLECAVGQVLDKPNLMMFVDNVVMILSKNITDPELLKTISEQMRGALVKCVEGAATAAQQRPEQS
jgi:hypothetical protein